MAIIRDENEKNRPKNTMGGSSFVGGGYQATAPSSATNSGGGASGGGGGRFTNIDRYLTGDLLTKGGEAASGMVSDVETEGNKIASDIDDASSLGSQLIKSNTPTFNQNTANTLLEGVIGADKTIDQTPTVPTLSTYSGPNEFTDLPWITGVEGRVSSLGTKASALGNLPGVQTAMSGKFGQPVSSLDAYGAQVAGGKGMMDASNKWGGVNNWLTGKLSDASTGFSNQVTGLRDAEKGVADQWKTFQGTLSDQVKNQNKVISDRNKRLEDEQKARDDWAKKQQTADQPGTIPPPPPRMDENGLYYAGKKPLGGYYKSFDPQYAPKGEF